MKELLIDMEFNGLPCHQDIIPDGRLHRYSYRETPVRDEWYVCHLLDNGEYVAVYGSWRKSHEDKRTFKSWDGERKELDSQVSDCLKQAQKELDKEIINGTKVAQELWLTTPLCVEHAYLTRKKIKPHGCRVFEGKLLVPVYDNQNKLISVQSILPDGTKRFARRTSTKFGRLVLGDIERAKRILVCEGFATGASIYEATGDCVVIAFSCSNLINVGFDLQCSYPYKSVALCQDLGDAGDTSAKHWLDKISKIVYKPVFKKDKATKQSEGDYLEGSSESLKDFNDMWCESSLGKDSIVQILCLRLSPGSISQLMEESRDIEWLVKDLIIKGSINMIYGPAGSGKSAISMELSYCISQGIKFWHYTPVKGRVLYVDGELSGSENKSRWGSIMRRHNNIAPSTEELKLLNPEMVYRDFEDAIDLYQPEWQRRLDPWIEWSDLVVLDNLSTLCGMGADAEFENRAASWIVIANWIKKWKALGKSFLVVHHANKQGGMRGTSRISVDNMTQIRLQPLDRGNFNSDIDVMVNFEKAREIRAEWKKAYTSKLENNAWDTSRF